MTALVSGGAVSFMPSAARTMGRLSSDDRARVEEAVWSFQDSLGRFPPQDIRERNRDGVYEYCELVLSDSLILGIRMSLDEDVFRVRVLSIGTPHIDYFASIVEQTLAGDEDTFPRLRLTPAPAGPPHAPARRATSVAARIAGRRRAYLHREWSAMLVGLPEEGYAPSPREQVRLAAGFVLAALRLRLLDLARPCWRPIDWVLRKETRTQAFIAVLVGAQAVYIVGNGGIAALMTEVWEPCGGAALALYALSRWLRRLRGIELSSSERRETVDE
jgi:hypothetical protein